MQITHSQLLDQSYFNRRFNFAFNCRSGQTQKTCLFAFIYLNGEFTIGKLEGIPRGCPSGKKLLRAAEEVGKQIGTDQFTLQDDSTFPIFNNQHHLRSTMLRMMLSDTEPMELSSYYSDRGYNLDRKYSARLNGYIPTVWNLGKDQLFENLAENGSAEGVRKVIEKYDLAPEDNVGALFRRLYHSQSEEMRMDCGILIDNFYDHSAEKEIKEKDISIKKGELREAIEEINEIHPMLKGT